VEALDAGPVDDLEAKYGNIRSAVGFDFDARLQPSVIFKPSV
jgi:hypothetical protein